MMTEYKNGDFDSAIAKSLSNAREVIRMLVIRVEHLEIKVKELEKLGATKEDDVFAGVL